VIPILTACLLAGLWPQSGQSQPTQPIRIEVDCKWALYRDVRWYYNVTLTIINQESKHVNVTWIHLELGNTTYVDGTYEYVGITANVTGPFPIAPNTGIELSAKVTEYGLDKRPKRSYITVILYVEQLGHALTYTFALVSRDVIAFYSEHVYDISEGNEANCTVSLFLTNGGDDDWQGPFSLPLYVGGGKIRKNEIKWYTNMNASNIQLREVGQYVFIEFTSFVPARTARFFKVTYVDEAFVRNNTAAYVLSLETSEWFQDATHVVVFKVPLFGGLPFLGQYYSKLFIDQVEPIPSSTYLEGGKEVLIWRNPLITTGSYMVYRVELRRHYGADWEKIIVDLSGAAIGVILSLGSASLAKRIWGWARRKWQRSK